MDIWCEDCGARFAEDCYCDGNQEFVEKMYASVDPERVETWRGMDGHKYTGDPKRASAARHDDDCGCPGSVNFDPDNWY